jgi:hypothetical protein
VTLVEEDEADDEVAIFGSAPLASRTARRANEMKLSFFRFRITLRVDIETKRNVFYYL